MDVFVDLTSICALAAGEGHRWGWTCQRVCSRRNYTHASCCRWSSLDPLCIHSRKIAPVPHLKFLSNEMALSFTDRKCKREGARCSWWERKYGDQICSRWSGTADPCTWKDRIGYTWKDGIYWCNHVAWFQPLRHQFFFVSARDIVGWVDQKDTLSLAASWNYS